MATIFRSFNRQHIARVATLAATLLTPPNLLGTTLAPAAPAQPPFSQTDWQNPVVRKADVSNRTWLQQINLNLLGKDKFFGEAGQPPANLNQPNPQRPRRNPQDWNQNLLQSTLTPAAQAPFSQTDWPNPNQRKPDVRGSVNAVNLNLIGQDRFFGAAGQPPANTDFPNPKAARRNPQDHNQNLLQSTLTPAVAGTPFSQDDGTNPVRRPRQPLGVIYHRVAMAAPAPAATPFFQSDWPNPRGRVSLVARISQLPTNISTMIEDFVAFSSMQDVPARVSRVPITSQQQGSQAQFIPATAAAPPFSQNDWPNPAIRKPAVRTTVNGVNLNLLSQDK